MIQILFTDRDLVPVGHPLAYWSDLDVVGRFNEPGSGTFRTAAVPEVVDQIQPGNRVVVIRDGEEFISGPIEKPGPYSWSVNDGGVTGYGEFAVTFAEDDALIASRITYPDPTQTSTNQTSVSHWTATATNAETVMRSLVNLNAGPGALLARRVPQLVLGDVAGVGDTVSITTRFEPLGDALRRVALAGGGLGYRTRQVGGSIVFEVYDPDDKSHQVRFSRALGNLRAVTYENEGPTATTVIVGGPGELTARTIRERTDAGMESSWWRVERFADQTQTAVTDELDAAGDQVLAENGEQVRITTVTIDTPNQRYGIEYGLGDQVSVELFPGVQVSQVVRGFHLQADANGGELLTAVIGTQEASRDPAWVKVGRDLARRLGQLERK